MPSWLCSVCIVVFNVATVLSHKAEKMCSAPNICTPYILPPYQHSPDHCHAHYSVPEIHVAFVVAPALYVCHSPTHLETHSNH